MSFKEEKQTSGQWSSSLKGFRLQRKFPREMVSRKSGIPLDRLIEIENAIVDPFPSELQRLFMALGMNNFKAE